METTIFSVHYQIGDEKVRFYDAYAHFAVDWDWKFSNQWSRSLQDGPGMPWEVIKGLDEDSYIGLLRHFGLEDWKTEFSMQKIIVMSPKELADARELKEIMLGLPQKQISSDTLGDHCIIKPGQILCKGETS